MTPQTIFDMVFKDSNTDTCIEKFYQSLGHSNIKISPWKVLEEDSVKGKIILNKSE